MTDELFDARNALTLGNYHHALAEANKARTISRKSDEVEAFNDEKSALLALAQIGIGQTEAVLNQLRTATRPVLVAVREWATFRSVAETHPTARGESPAPEVQAALDALLVDTQTVKSTNTRRAVNATAALIMVGDYSEALALAHKWLDALPAPVGSAECRQRVELHALCLEALLRINRVDKAKAELDAMEAIDDEALVKVLYAGIYSLAQAQQNPGNADLYREALSYFVDAASRGSGGPSAMLLNLQAVAHMGLGENDKARDCLMDALGARSGDPDTLANLAVLEARTATDSQTISNAAQQALSVDGAWSREYRAQSAKLDALLASSSPVKDNGEWF